MFSKLIRNTALVFGLVVAGPVQADSITVLYSSRSDFGDALKVSITDTYENPGYDPVGDEQSDAAMSSVLGETRYTTTGFPNHNMVADGFTGFDHAYCAGCNGSFTLDFTETSIRVYLAWVLIFASTACPTCRFTQHSSPSGTT